MKLYMFQTVRLSIIRSLFTVHSTMVCHTVCRQLSSIHPGPARKAVYKPVWQIPLLSVQWINSWRWTDELSETCRVSCRNKFMKLIHLVGCTIIKKFVTLHGHMNVKNSVVCQIVRHATSRLFRHLIQTVSSMFAHTPLCVASLIKIPL